MHISVYDDQLFVDMVDIESQRVFDCLLQHKLEVVTDEFSKDGQVFSESFQDRLHNRSKQGLALLELSPAGIEDEIDFDVL